MAEDRIQASAKLSASAPAEFTKNRKKAGKEARAPQAKAKADDSPSPHRDSLREILETIVFVAILVLLLRTFVAEAFIIPTGSMGPTLLGHHDTIVCPQCKRPFRVNTSKEVDEQGNNEPVTGCTCPNCRYHVYRQSPLSRRTVQFRGP